MKSSTECNPMLCPLCRHPMQRRLAETVGLVVTEEKTVEALYQIKKAEDEGKAGHAVGGMSWPIVSGFPYDIQKFIICMHCEDCELVIVQHGPFFLTPDAWGKEKELFTYQGELFW